MKKWPVSKNLVGALKAAFAKGVPTDAQAERMQLRDMRAKYNNKKWKVELEEDNEDESDDEKPKQPVSKRDDDDDDDEDHWNKSLRKAGINPETSSIGHKTKDYAPPKMDSDKGKGKGAKGKGKGAKGKGKGGAEKGKGKDRGKEGGKGEKGKGGKGKGGKGAKGKGKGSIKLTRKERSSKGKGKGR